MNLQNYIFIVAKRVKTMILFYYAQTSKYYERNRYLPMKDNKNVWFYILGTLSGLLFIPVIEEFINVIMTWIQVLMIKPSKKVLKGNQKLAKYQEPEEYQETNCMGFQMPDDYYYEDDDEYDE